MSVGTQFHRGSACVVDAVRHPCLGVTEGGSCETRPVHLGRPGENEVDLCVVGYQFPDVEDPRLRFSWNMVSGSVQTPNLSWNFTWQALTCDEPPKIVRWLLEAADSLDDPLLAPPPRLSFTEPNLALEVVGREGSDLRVVVELDAEFKPPDAQSRYAGDPLPIEVRASSSELRRAASDLDQDIAKFPDLS